MKNHIWQSEANPSQDHAGYAAQRIPENVAIVVVQRTSSGIEICASELIQTSATQRLWLELLGSPHQLASVCDAIRIIEKHGVVLSNTVVRYSNEAEGAIFYGKDLLMPEFVAFLELVEREIAEFYGLGLDLLETNSAQPFAILACH